jgi:ATP-dependent protease HslVU (ClpYQ) peptidase subunit
MTCIAAFVEDNICHVGGDRAGSSGAAINTYSSEKIFTNGPFVIGCAGSFRQMQVMRYEFEPPPVREKLLTRYMIKSFVPALRNALDRCGVLHKDSGAVGTHPASSAVVAYRGHAFELYADFCVLEPADGIAAIGSGGCEARAVLAALKDDGRLTAREKLERALEIAARFTDSVSPPFDFLHT